MPLQERQKLIQRIAALRGGRTCVVLFNFDRDSFPKTPGFGTQFESSVKEPIFRVLKEATTEKGLDIFIYTRGGDVNAVWPVVSLIREFDQDFEVLLPYSCHSAGTMFALGASKIILGPLSELSPIDPTCGNAFNPIDPVSNRDRLGISVEDVNAYREFVLRQFGEELSEKEQQQLFGAFLQQLTSQVHPLALGNVHRVFQQGRQLAKQLLELNDTERLEVEKVVDELSSKFFSHLHMINRHEAKRILDSRVEFAPDELATAMDALLRSYEIDFNLRRKFVVKQFMGTDTEKDARVIGGAVESQNWSYLHETKLHIRRKPEIPQNIQLHLKPGDDVNSIIGLPESIEFSLSAEAWVRNTTPLGITK